jgi:hypothetical protein
MSAGAEIISRSKIPVRHAQHPGPAFGLAALGSPLTGIEPRTLRAEGP